MNHSKFQELLNQYEFRNKAGNGYLLFEKHKDWFKQNAENGQLKLALEETLKDLIQNKDLRKYDFVLLIIQAFSIDFAKKDKHFELLFLIADAITEDFKVSKNGDEKSWLLHQLTDICIHNGAEIELVAKRIPKLIPSVVAKIGKVKYKSQEHGPQMYFAAYKAVDLCWYMPKAVAKRVMEEIYLKHFDERVIEETEELIEYLKEEGRYG